MICVSILAILNDMKGRRKEVGAVSYEKLAHFRCGACKKWWSIGIRIEDDILITSDGYKNLSASAPRTVAEIEKTMKQKSIFD